MDVPRPGKFVPALGFSWLTPLFDVILKSTTREELFRRRLIDQADLKHAANVLDLGCGTGTLAVRIKRQFPRAAVVGLDADEVMLARARSKAAAAETNVHFDRGLSNDLPYHEGSFDRVVSTLFFHHLDGPQKLRTLEETLRVLKPGGELHVADWGRPTGPVMGGMFLVVRLSDGFNVTHHNAAGKIPDLVERAGFIDVRDCGALNMLFGTLRFLAARKPG